MIITEEIIQHIYELYEECLNSKKQFHRKLDLFLIPVNLTQKIFEQTNIDVSDHWICIDNFGIIHALEEHGNPISEARRGQVAIEKEDFIKMLDVCLNPDEIKNIGESRHTKKPLLQFTRKINDKIYVVKEIRTITSTKKNKVSRLVFQTMYKIKSHQD